TGAARPAAVGRAVGRDPAVRNHGAVRSADPVPKLPPAGPGEPVVAGRYARRPPDHGVLHRGPPPRNSRSAAAALGVVVGLAQVREVAEVVVGLGPAGPAAVGVATAEQPADRGLGHRRLGLRLVRRRILPRPVPRLLRIGGPPAAGGAAEL